MKDNELIAEFMGVGKHYEAQSSNQFNQYHQSWDWLMPVVKKISDVKGWSLNSTLEWLSESQDWDGLYDMKDIFQAVLEFINQNNKAKL